MDHNDGGSDAGPSVVRIGPFILATAEGQLYRDAKRVPLGKRAIALLRGLIDSPGHAVTRDELVRRVWPGRFVEDANLNVQIGAMGQAGKCTASLDKMSRRGRRSDDGRPRRPSQ